MEAATTKTQAAPKASSQVGRDRSPSYPSVEFTFALEKVKRLYEKEKQHEVRPEIAFAEMGNGSFNGYARGILGAMKQYGLIESIGNGIRVTNDAAYIAVYPEGDTKRSRLLRELPMRPKIFREIIQRFPPSKGLPSDANLSAFLQLEMHFTKDACPKVIKALKHSLDLAGDSLLEMMSVDESEESAENGAADASQEAPMVTQTPPPTPLSTQAQSLPRVTQPPPIAGYQSRTWKLENNKVAVVQLPPDLTRRDLEKLGKYVAALQAEASISWDDETEEK